MGPPPHSDLAETTQQMPYAASAQQPTNISQNTKVAIAGSVVTEFFLFIV